MMSRDQNNIEELVYKLRNQPAAERKKILTVECKGDPEKFQETESLLYYADLERRDPLFLPPSGPRTLELPATKRAPLRRRNPKAMAGPRRAFWEKLCPKCERFYDARIPYCKFDAE